MNKEEILNQLKDVSGSTSLRFPSDLDIFSKDGVLTIFVNTKGLENNMQTDPSAFEGWAIAIKSIAPDLAKFVTIQWTGIGLEKGTNYNHYRRFLYRVIRFTQSYDWTSFKPLDNQAASDIENVNSELSEWVVNYPKNKTQDNATMPEALLERKIKSFLPAIHDQQLPVGMFYKIKSNKTRRTPGGKAGIDLWSLEGCMLNIYELKTDINNPAGIISELMFYTNVMQDLVSGTIKYASGADKVTIRSFDKLYYAICSKQITKVYGVFLSNNLHPILQIRQEELFEIINQNTRKIHYKQVGFDNQSIFDISK